MSTQMPTPVPPSKPTPAPTPLQQQAMPSPVPTPIPTPTPAPTPLQQKTKQCLTISDARPGINGPYDLVGVYANRPKYCSPDGSRVLSYYGSCSGWMSICSATGCSP